MSIYGKKYKIDGLQSQLAETDEALITLYEAQEAQDSTQVEQTQTEAQEGGEVSA